MAFNDTKSPGDLITSQDWNDFVDYTEGISGQLSLHTSNNDIHLTPTEKSSLTGGGDTSLHYHSADRDLSNATGILGIEHGGTNNSSFVSGNFIAYNGTKLLSTSYNSSSFAAASHEHDASDITTGTISPARYSAYDDLVDENKIGSGSDQVASGSHLHDDRYYTKTQSDNRYFPSSTGHSHINDTSNPHNVTYSQVGAIQDANDTVKSSHIDWGTGTNQVSLDDVPDGSTYGKLTITQRDNLTNGGDTSLHYHSSDRDLSNATGILGISHGGTNNSSFTSGKFIAYDGTKLASTSYDASSFASSTHTHSASDITSGVLAYERGGLNADVSSFNGLVKIAGGSTSYINDNSSNWDAAYSHSQVTSGNPHNVALSELPDVSLSDTSNGEVLAYIGGAWKNSPMPITFSTPAVGLRGNRFIRIGRFKLPTDKSFYLWQAAVCDIDGNSVADLKIELLSGNTVVFSTSSNQIQIGSPLATISPGSDVTVRIAFSGASVSDTDDVKCLGFAVGSVI